jgi:hypothetical protein
MSQKLAPHEVMIDAELAIDFIHLGDGDIQLGLRVARAAAVDLATDPPRPGLAYDSIILRHLRAAESTAETARKLLLHADRIELERRAFLDAAARLGRLNESDST